MSSDEVTQQLNEHAVEARIAGPLVLAIVLIISLDFLLGKTYSQNILVVGLIMAGSFLFSLTHLIPAFQFGKRHGIYLFLYHALLAVCLVFIVPTLSYYLLIWTILAYLSEYYYQAKGIYASLIGLLITIAAGVAYQNQNITTELLWNALTWYIVLSVIILMLSRVMLGNRAKRLELSEKVIHAEYEHERMINLINSMTEAVLSIDEKGIINVYNAAALDLLDTNVELAGKQIDEVLHLIDDRENPISALTIAQTTHYLQKRSDVFLRFGDNDTIALELDISRTSLQSALSKKQGFTLLLRDITRQKSLDEERDEFISVVSHELRTPITIAEANVSMAQLLITKPDKKIEEMSASLDKAHKQVLFLSDMVNDLSTLSRAERTDKEMDLEIFDVADVLEELAATYRPQAEAKSLYLKLDIGRALPRMTTSRLYFKEILQNFITNAIKYSPKGGITVSASYEKNSQLKISVADTGIGIAKSEQDNVFDKFWRSEDPLTRQTGGTGLGLYITAKLARRIGANIDFQSEAKKGSVFSLFLPVVAVSEIDKKNVVDKEVENILD
jgi:signal transduction histidine kinase